MSKISIVTGGCGFIGSHIVDELVKRLKEFNILVLKAGCKNQYIRILPPLNITREEIEIFVYHMNHLLNRYIDNIK